MEHWMTRFPLFRARVLPVACLLAFACSTAQAEPPTLKLYYDNGAEYCEFKTDYMGVVVNIVNPRVLHASGQFLGCGDGEPFGAVHVSVTPANTTPFQNVTVSWNAPGATVCTTEGSSLPQNVPQWPANGGDLCIGSYECEGNHSFTRGFIAQGTYTFVLSCKAPGHLNDPHTATAVLHIN